MAIDLYSDRTLHRARVLLLVFITLTFISTIVSYVVVINNLNWLIQYDSRYAGSYKTMKTLAIIYLVLMDVDCIVGYVGAAKNNVWIVTSFTIGMAIIWVLRFTNYGLLKFTVYGHIIVVGAILSGAFFVKILRNRLQHPVVSQTNVISHGAPSIIQVSPTYIPNLTTQTGPAPTYVAQSFPNPGPDYNQPSGFSNPNFPNTGYPNTVYPNTGYPNTGYPNTGYPDPGHPNPGHPNPGYPPAGFYGGQPELQAQAPPPYKY